MKKLSRRMRELRRDLDLSVPYSIRDGIKLLQKSSMVKFTESIDVAVNLGINPKQSDQQVRGSVILPYRVGRMLKVAVFTQGQNVKLAKESGADLVGLEDLYDYVEKTGAKDLDVVLASPDVMHVVSKLGPILGPKGLMPNPKTGTVLQNIVSSIRDIKLGQIQYKNDKNGIVHVLIGKINFDVDQVQSNLKVLIQSIKQAKPVKYKGTYIKRIFISTTMGFSVLIDKDSLGVSIY